MAEADAAFGDFRECGVFEMAVVGLGGIFDAHEKVVRFFDDGDVVFDVGSEESDGKVVGGEASAFEGVFFGEVASGAEVGGFVA